MLHKLLHIIIVPFFRHYNYELVFFERPGAVYLAVPVAVHIWEHLDAAESEFIGAWRLKYGGRYPPPISSLAQTLISPWPCLCSPFWLTDHSS